MWNSIIELCYIIAMLISTVAWTIEWLATKGEHEDSKAMVPFIRMLLVMNLFGFFLHSAIRFESNFFSPQESLLAVRVGSGLLTGLSVLWIKGLSSKTGKSAQIYGFAKKYIIFYLAALSVGMGLFVQYNWVRLIIDIPMILLFFIGCPISIKEGAQRGESKEATIYKISVTALLVVTYFGYFIGEIAITSKLSESIVSLTVFCWIIIDTYTAIEFYRKGFSSSYRIVKPGRQVWNLDRELEQVRQKYNLTDREKEILGEMYNGKTNPQIGESLFISRSTVKAHIYNLFKKMGVKNRVEAVRLIKNQEERDI